MRNGRFLSTAVSSTIFTTLACCKTCLASLSNRSTTTFLPFQHLNQTDRRHPLAQASTSASPPPLPPKPARHLALPTLKRVSQLSMLVTQIRKKMTGLGRGRVLDEDAVTMATARPIRSGATDLSSRIKATRRRRRVARPRPPLAH